MTKVYYSQFQYEDWRLYLAKTDKGLCYIGSPNKPFEELESWVKKKIKGAELEENPVVFKEDIKGLLDYMYGRAQDFKITCDIVGTDFQRQVWHAMEEVPYGTTTTYKAIAEKINNPKAVRAVGTAIGANPLLMILPCHRVVTVSGSLSGFRAGLDMKAFLIDLEKTHA